MEGQRPNGEWRDEASRVVTAAASDRLHPEQEAEVLRRAADGQKPVPAKEMWSRLGL